MLRPSHLVSLLFEAFNLILFARVLLSWVRLRRGTFLADRLAPALYSLTEPLLAPVRRALRPYQGATPVDFSPIILILALGVVAAVLTQLLKAAGL